MPKEILKKKILMKGYYQRWKHKSSRNNDGHPQGKYAMKIICKTTNDYQKLQQ